MWFWLEVVLFAFAVLAVWEMFFRGGFLGYRAEASRYIADIRSRMDVEETVAP